MPLSSLSPESNQPDIEHNRSSSSNNNAEHSSGRNSRTFTLTLVATPIGNLSDFSPRAVQALSKADLILCEDTRTTARLLNEYNISVKTEALHEHNEEQRVPALIRKLEQGVQIALVSDAGMPLLSDPGYRLVRAAIEADIDLTVIPGPNAALTALVLSGLPPHPFMFIGFPPPRSSARKEGFAKLHAAEHAGLTATLIWHESPHRLSETLTDMQSIFGPTRQAAVARELTKRFEEVKRGTLEQLNEYYTTNTPRGEITVILGPPAETQEASQDSLDDTLRSLLETHSVKDAATLAATAAGLPRRTVYARALELTTKGKT